MKRFIPIFLFQIYTLIASPDAKGLLDLTNQSTHIDYPTLKEMGFGNVNNLDEVVQFIRQFQDEIKLRYGIKPILLDAIELAKNMALSNHQFNNDEKNSLVTAYDLLIEKLGYRESESWGFGKKKKSKHRNSPEFELPGKLAAGFMCTLGGALLCIIPGGQGLGLTLIGVGLGVAIDGMANGERPYYVDSEARKRISTLVNNNQDK